VKSLASLWLGRAFTAGSLMLDRFDHPDGAINV